MIVAELLRWEKAIFNLYEYWVLNTWNNSSYKFVALYRMYLPKSSNASTVMKVVILGNK